MVGGTTLSIHFWQVVLDLWRWARGLSVKLSDHGNEHIGLKRNIAEQTMKELEDAKDDQTPKIVKECPVNFLREVKEDGSDIFIGSLNINTSVYGELMGPDGVDWENKKKLEDENNSLKAGDARIVWCFGGKPWLIA